MHDSRNLLAPNTEAVNKQRSNDNGVSPEDSALNWRNIIQLLFTKWTIT